MDSITKRNANWPLIALIALCIAGYLAYDQIQQKFEDIEATNNQKQAELQDALNAAEAKAQDAQDSAEEAQAERAADEAKDDLTQVLIQYKLDTAQTTVRDGLMNAAYNSPSGLCPSIVASRTTRNNIYYLVIDDLSNLEAKYGLYRDSIPYINTNLNSIDAMLSIVRDQCSAIGYSLPLY